MRRLLLLSIILLAFTSIHASSTYSKIQGTVMDIENSEPMPFVNLKLLMNGAEKAYAQSDFDGHFQFDSIQPGTYSLQAASVGFKPVHLMGIIVVAEETKIVDIKMNSTSIEMKEFVVTSYKSKFIDKGNTAVRTVNKNDYKKMARRSKKGVANNTAGVYSYDNGSENLNIRGSRTDANYYYVDGMKTGGEADLASYSNESYATITDNPYLDVINNPLSTFSIDVDKASYTNVRRFISQGYLPPVDAVRIEEMVNYFNYDYPQPEGDIPFSISTEYTDCPWNPKHKLVHIGIQGKEIEMETAPSNNLVFLIDVSGSMNSPDKLGLLKTGLTLLVNQLRKEDRVAIVVYAGAAGLALPSTSGANKNEIKAALRNLRAGGSTAGGAGIELAYIVAKKNFIKEGNNRIILASDGDFNVGISSQEQLIKLIESKRNDNIFLTTLGFGTGNLQDSKMEQLADKGNGNYNYIDNALEAKKVFVSELGANLITIAKDVKVQVEFNPVHVKGYRLIGYVNRKLNDEDFNDDTKDAGEIGSGHNVTMMYEIIPAGSEEQIVNIDKLKYQKGAPEIELPTLEAEVLTVKFRYKEPTGTTSKLIEEVLYDESIPFYETSENCRFSASVASFGMLLRKSDFKGDYNFENVIKLAKESKGDDDDGSRSEFIQLVKMVAVL